MILLCLMNNFWLWFRTSNLFLWFMHCIIRRGGSWCGSSHIQVVLVVHLLPAWYGHMQFQCAIIHYSRSTEIDSVVKNDHHDRRARDWTFFSSSRGIEINYWRAWGKREFCQKAYIKKRGHFYLFWGTNILVAIYKYKYKRTEKSISRLILL